MFGIKKCLLLVFFALVCGISSSQEYKKPKLIVGVVLENFNPDYIDMYSSLMCDDGFNRLVNSSAYFQNAYYPYLYSLTGVDQASIYSGCMPSEHGIISHAWYDRLKKRSIDSFDVGNYLPSQKEAFSNYSPKKLLVSCLGDELKNKSICSRVFGVAFNAESAIYSAGHRADAAYWFSTNEGKWQSSKYYMDSLYSWAEDYNKTLDLNYIINRGWYPLSQERSSKSFLGASKLFHHNLSSVWRKDGNYSVLANTPYANILVTEFSKNLIIKENLGLDNDVDILNINYSFLAQDCDAYLVDSDEKKDAFCRLDSDLSNLFQFLDKQVGKGNYLVMVTVSESMQSSPEELHKKKMPGGLFSSFQAISLLKSYLNITYGPGDWILSYDSQQIFLNRRLIELKKLKLSEVQDLVADFLIDFSGVNTVIPAYALRFSPFFDGVEKLIHNSYNQKRSGDVMYSLSPGWVVACNDREDYLAKYSSNRRVPLFFYGLEIKANKQSRKVSILDIAPTLSSFMGISFLKDCGGSILDL